MYVSNQQFLAVTISLNWRKQNCKRNHLGVMWKQISWSYSSNWECALNPEIIYSALLFYQGLV